MDKNNLNNGSGGDRDLVERLSRGDGAAMKEVFRAYYLRLYFFAVRVIGNKNDAEDLVQESLVNFWVSIKDKQVIPGNLKGYLFRITRNLCITYLRKQSARERDETATEQFYHNLNDELNEVFIQEELYNRVYSRFDSLTPVQAQIMNLLYNDGLSVQQVAEQLATTDNNVRNHKARALERLKSILSKEILTLFLFFLKKL